MKKKYFSPQVRSFTILPAQIIATSVAVGKSADPLNAVEDESNIFWSKTFGGTIVDDVHSSSSDYSSSDFGE